MVCSLQWRAEWDFVRKGVGVGHIHLDCLLHTTLQMKHHHQVTHMIDILLNQFQNIRLIFSQCSAMTTYAQWPKEL